MGKNKNKKKNQTSEAPVETPEDDTKMTEESKDAQPSDGVKWLEEVFGSKASVNTTSASDDTTSIASSSDDGSKEDAPKTEVIGPLPPGEEDFEED